MDPLEDVGPDRALGVVVEEPPEGLAGEAEGPIEHDRADVVSARRDDGLHEGVADGDPHERDEGEIGQLDPGPPRGAVGDEDRRGQEQRLGHRFLTSEASPLPDQPPGVSAR